MNLFGNESGTYHGTIDDILNRHDPHQNYNPQSYPNWSDSKWAGIYHSHNKALRIIEKQREGEKIKEKSIARENLIRGLQAVLRLKELKIENQEKYKARCTLLILLKSKDSKEVLKRVKELREALSYEADDLLLWFWSLMVISIKNTNSKKYRKDAEGVVQEIRPLLEGRNLPLSGDELYKYMSSIKPERMKEIENLMGYFVPKSRAFR